MIRLLPFLLSLALVTSAEAHFVWLDVSSDTSDSCAAKIYFGEYNNNQIEKREGRLGEFKDLTLKNFSKEDAGTAVPLTMEQMYLQGSTARSDTGNMLFAYSDSHDVVDYTKYQIGIVKPVFSARAFCDSLNSELLTPVSTGLDVLPVQTSKDELQIGSPVSFKVYYNGKPISSGPKIFAIAPNGWMKEVEVKDGEGTFTPLWAGLYVIDVVYRDSVAGTYKNKTFEGTRHRSTLSIKID